MPLLQPPGPDLRPSDLSYVDAYNSIVSRVRRSGGSGSGGVVVFCGADVDGLFAARILASLFKQDDIPYRLVPVGSYSELEAKRDEAFTSEELHTLILLSLGSLLPLAQYFTLPKGCHLHIIDAHRPWNLSNLFGLELDAEDEEDDDEGQVGGSSSGPGRFWVWGDGEEFGLNEVKKSWEALEYEPSDSESDSDDDQNDGEDDDEDEVDEADEEENGDEEDADDDNRPGPSRKRARSRAGSSGPPKKRKAAKERDRDPDLPRRLPRAVRDAHYDRIQRYYESGTSWGMSVAQSIYLLATVLERADNDLLWLAILGATHQYVANQIDRDQYEAYHELFLDEVVRLNHDVAPTTANGIGRTPNPDDRSIQRSDELRFMLFRHWTLYDAMLHSGYVAGRLGIWKERGRKKLQGLLAKMGFSLQQCTQSYPHMDTNLKRSLPEKLEAIAPEYGLIELSYPSFSRSFGFALSALSAADAVEGLSALLEAATGQRMEIEREGGRNGGEWFGGTRAWNVNGREAGSGNGAGSGSGDGKENVDPAAAAGQGQSRSVGGDEMVKETQEGKRKEQSWQVANFWIAYDACEDVSLLRKSLLLAKSLHTSIIRQGSSLLDKSTIRPLRTFRFCALKEGPDLRLFTHPATLSRLALWLMDATRDKWAEKAAKVDKRRKELPFVVAALDESKGTWLVVGITGGMEYGSVRKNKFGLAFQQAAEESGAGSKHDMFDTSVVEVAKDDLTAFIECLHLRSV